MINGRKRDDAIEGARRAVERATRDGREPGREDAWLAKMRTSYEVAGATWVYA
jgi:hypothetical protein